MTDTKKLNTLIDCLASLKPEERIRYINAALTFLGDVPVAGGSSPHRGGGDSGGGVAQPTSVGDRLKRHAIPVGQIEQVFHFHDDGTFGIISVPGKSKKEKALNTYVLLGLGTYLATGKYDFSDAAAREMCKSHACYDQANHATYLKAKHPAFIAKGDDWALTIPGIKEAAALVKEVADAANK